MTTMDQTAAYVAARASESLSYGDIAYAQSQGWCSSSPDGMGSHRPDDTTDPVTCAECGATIDPDTFYTQYLSDENMADLAGSMTATYRGDETEGLQAIVSERDGGIIAYAIGLDHAGQIVAALNAAKVTA